jgi:hypothetical protein
MLAWLFHRRSRDTDPQERAVWGDLISLGMVFPICIFTGFFLGRWVGGKLGHPDAGKLTGLVWGIAAAFWELYKTTERLNRLDPPPGEPPSRDGDSGP